MISEKSAKYTSRPNYSLLEYLKVLEKGEFDFVYRPNDDTYLFLDCLYLEKEDFLEKNFILEIGSGSGILINHLSHWIKQSNETAQFFAIDINYDACNLTKKISDQYKVNYF